MTKEDLLASYLKNLSAKLDSLDFTSANKLHVAQQAVDIHLAMWNKLNAHFQEHFIDDLTDVEIEAYFNRVKQGTNTIFSALPIDIRNHFNELN